MARSIGVLFAAILLLASVHFAHAQGTAPHAWVRAVAAKVEKGKRYPPKALKNRIEGFVVVRFTVDRSGALIETLIDKTSCSAALDREALAAVLRAAPFAPIPADMHRSTVSFKQPFLFSIGRFDQAARDRIAAIRCPEVSGVARNPAS